MMKTDIEIASSAKVKPIIEIAKQAKIPTKGVELYGNYKAKLDLPIKKAKAKLVLVTAMNPTPMGEGKTTVSIGLADALKSMNKNVMLALREPSLGPVFGIKGGAAGGGYAQLYPMADLNLHFTGDIHAITTANNLLSAMIDNHMHFGNKLKIKTVTFKRCMDMNDRALRIITVGQGKNNDPVREDGFTITAACEVMAILCLASDMEDLKKRLGNIIIGYNEKDKPVYARELKAENAMAILLKDALKPNLIQSLEGTPAIVHGGPFANIAHGCNSIVATKMALGLSDIVVTEAGFGADLGAEKFLDIKCRTANIEPDCVVIVATVRSLKYNGGVDKNHLTEENLLALQAGISNLLKHVDNIQNVFNKPAVVAINRFPFDTKKELALVQKECEEHGAYAVPCDVWAKGGKGGIELANAVLKLFKKKHQPLHFSYNLNDSITKKIESICKKVYGASGIELTEKAKEDIKKIEKQAKGLPVCIAKTQYSLSDDAKKLGRPENYLVKVREVIYRGGAGFVVAVCGSIMLMPGLSEVPAAVGMEINKELEIKGLF